MESRDFDSQRRKIVLVWSHFFVGEAREKAVSVQADKMSDWRLVPVGEPQGEGGGERRG